MEATWKLVKADCEELLGRFQKTDSVRFEVFSKIWREMKFSHIFYGTRARQKQAFSRLALDAAYGFLLPPFSFHIRVGGLYLLHSLYHSQTAQPPEQIRLALRDWEGLRCLEQDAEEAQHLDVVYILRQLKVNKAFSFTAMPTLLSFRKKRRMERSPLCEDFMQRASRPQQLVTVELLEEVSNIHEIYGKLKAGVFPASEEEAASVSLIHKDFVPQLRTSVVDFYKWQQKKDGADEEDDGGEGTSSQLECSKRAENLASIKAKAFGEAAEATRSRRHRQVEVDLSSNTAGPSHSTGVSKASKPSLRARTNERVRISGEIWKETSAATQINCLTTLDFVPEGKPRGYKKIKR